MRPGFVAIMEGGNRASGTVVGLAVEERSKPHGIRLKQEDLADSPAPNGSRLASGRSSMAPDDSKSAPDSAHTPENGSAPKLARKPSQKMAASRNPPPVFDHLPNATEDACSTFQVITDCLYGSRNMGSSDHDALDCDCAEEWRMSPPFSLSLSPPFAPPRISVLIPDTP